MSKDILNLLYKREELKDEVLKHFKNRIVDYIKTDIIEYVFERGTQVTIPSVVVYSDGRFILDNKIVISLLEVVDIVVRNLKKDKNHIWY